MFVMPQNKATLYTINERRLNNMNKRILSTALAFILAFSTITITANAQSVQDSKSAAVVFLDNYLNDLKNGNINSAFNCTIDERETFDRNINISILSSDERDYVEYVKSGHSFRDLYAEEAITNYTILEEKDDNIITAELVFENGNEAIVPFNVIPNGNSYKVYFTLDDICEMGYVETKSVQSNEIVESSMASILATGTWKYHYTFSYLYGTIYGTNTFSVSKNAIRIDGYQANYMLSSGWTSNAEVIYAVVVQHWYGDDVWAKTNGSVVTNGSFSRTIVGKNSSQSGLRIRISNQTGAYPRSEGNGDLYSVTV